MKFPAVSFPSSNLSLFLVLPEEQWIRFFLVRLTNPNIPNKIHRLQSQGNHFWPGELFWITWTIINKVINKLSWIRARLLVQLLSITTVSLDLSNFSDGGSPGLLEGCLVGLSDWSEVLPSLLEGDSTLSLYTLRTVESCRTNTHKWQMKFIADED